MLLQFTISNFKGAITYKCGRVVLFRTSVYFAISKLILLFSYSFHVPCIILSNVYFYIVLSMFLFFLIDHNQKQVLLIKWVIFPFEAQKWCFFQLFENGSTLCNSTLKIATLFGRQRCQSWNMQRRFDVVNFNIGIHNVVSTLIWQCPMSS